LAVSQRPADAAPPAPPLALVDGSQLEGGGQILRNASALAAVTGGASALRLLVLPCADVQRPAVALRVHSIRAGRDRPGLRPQHLTGLQLVATLTSGALFGGAVGSSDVTLTPGAPLRAGEHTADTGTAGSCVLLAQTALPCLLLASPGAAGERTSRLRLLGGTDAAMAPPVDFMRLVLLPTLRAQLRLSDDELHADVPHRGFYPRGGGEVLLTARALAPGQALPPLRLERRGAVVAVRGVAFTAGSVPQNVAERMASAAKAALHAAGFGAPVAVVETRRETPEAARGDGAGITLVAETDTGCLLGASALGERGVSAEEVGTRCGRALAVALASGACVDEYAADQLVIFMALAAGESAVLAPAPLSLHTRTAIAVAQQLTRARFEAQEGPPGATTCLLRCSGAGITPRGAGGAAEAEAAAMALADAGDWAAAAPAFEAAAAAALAEPAASARVAPLWEMAAQAWLEGGEAARAITAARAAADAAPGWAEAALTLGRALRNGGAFADAADALRRAAAMVPATDAPAVEAEAAEAAELAELAVARVLPLPGGAELRLLETAHQACACAGDATSAASGPARRVWEAGIVLSRWLALGEAAGAPTLRGRRVLDLGAGTGIAGLAAAALGADVTLSDTEEALPLLRRNVAANARTVADAGGAARVACLDWAAPPAELADEAPWDVVLAADVVYSPTQLAPFTALLGRLAARNRPGGPFATLLLAHKERDEALTAALLAAMSASGVAAVEVPLDAHDPEACSRSVRLFACTPLP
jgi:RNA 3'-terminal phosphate cyclase (ATP)